MAPSLLSILAATVVASHLALAIPTSNHLSEFNPSSHPSSLTDTPLTSKDTWTINQARSTEASPDGPLTLATIYQKYERPIPEDLQSAINRYQKRNALYNDKFAAVEAFQLPVWLGTSQQQLNLIFDTSSSGIWVVSEEAANPEMQEAYKPADSTESSEMKGYSWGIDQGNGKVASGVVYKDTVTLGAKNPHLVSKEQAIQVAKSASGFDKIKGVSGVMGMAFSSRSPIKPEPQPTIFDNLVKDLEESVFSVNIFRRDYGDVRFGFFDVDEYEGEPGCTDVNTDAGLWNFTIEGLVSDNTPAPTGTEYVIADTASSMVMLPLSYTSTYYKQIPDARYSITYGGFVFPCKSKMPDFPFRVEDVDLAIPGENMNFAPVDSEEHLCFGSLQPSNELGFNIFGNIAFTAGFVIFDPVEKQIGWAKKQVEKPEEKL